MALFENFEEDCCAALPGILEKTLAQGEAGKANGDPNFWKQREAAMLALGSVQKSVDRMVAKRLLNFDVTGFLENVVLADVVNPGNTNTWPKYSFQSLEKSALNH